MSAKAVVSARGDAQKLRRIFEHSHVPMVMVDGTRRFVEVNRPARLVSRLSLDEMRRHRIDDFTPSHMNRLLEQTWGRLYDAACLAGSYQVAGPDGSRLEIVYFGLAHVLPGEHLIGFAPADWPADELEAIRDDGGELQTSLTPRELELLALTADGLTGPELAQELMLSPATINTHFKNIYAKLNVHNRPAAVAWAIRLCLIH